MAGQRVQADRDLTDDDLLLPRRGYYDDGDWAH